MHIFDQSWYRGVYEGEIGEKDVTEFEKMLIQDGTLIVKFFLLISAKEQKNVWKRWKKMKTPDGVCVNRKRKIIKLCGVLEKAGFDIGTHRYCRVSVGNCRRHG